MKNATKKLSAWLLVFVLMLGMIPAIYAATGTMEKDGLVVELRTDKDSYTSGETIKTFVVTRNKGTEELTNIKVQVTAPEGVKLEGDGIVTVAELKAGEEKEQEVIVTTTVSGTQQTNTAASTETGANSEAAASTQTSASSEAGTSSNQTANPPKTADAWVWMLFAIVFVAGGAGCLLFGYKKKKLGSKILGVFVLVAALAAVSIPSTVSAAVLSGSFEVSVTVKVDGKDTVIVAKVTYGNATTSTESSEQPSGSEAQQPSGGDTQQPSGGDTQQPSGGDTQQPSGGEEQPSGGDTQQPSGGDTQQPSGGDTQQPSGGDTQQPSGGDTQQPSGGDTQQPSGGEEQPSGGEEQPSASIKRVSVHDPSIVKDGDTYYIFGSHMAWAKSTDLVNWETFTNNINRDFRTIFAEPTAWSASGNPDYDVAGNLWAPDVIYNDTMGKWCMYMSVNGIAWNSSIVLLTADSLDGDWTYVGPVIYSGFTPSNYSNDFSRTDYTEVTGETTLDARYTRAEYTCSYEVNGQTKQTAPTVWSTGYGAHAIDPCVLYDGGKLYMTYGSWSGGIYMIELDEETGLRDYSVKYNYDSSNNRSDPYMGTKLAGGYMSSGEASYVQKIGDYYYLFVTYGGLTANGGYNMRVFRSSSIGGPYADPTGQSARNNGGQSNKQVGEINGPVGERLMAYYKWSFMNSGYCAQGHNSVLVDGDGKIFVVYHTRFNNRGEMHEVRVHQAFVNEDGWLVVAPFEYRGETLSEEGYTAEQVAGSYEVLFQQQEGEAHVNKECVQGINLGLNADGTISGDRTGTWTWSEAGSPYVDMVIEGVTYNGVFLEQTVEGKTETAYTFTVLGVLDPDEVNVWGYRKATEAGGDLEELPTAMYLYDFEAGLNSIGTKTGAATIQGGGTIIDDTDSNSGRGKIFNNAAGVDAQKRVDYLSLPAQVGSDIAASANRAFSIAMWIKSPVGNAFDKNYGFFSPLFAMKDADNTTDFWPLVNVGLRGSSQVNWGGWIDNKAIEDTAYIEDNQWHYVVATFSETKTVVYIDGVVINSATNTSDNTCAGIFGAAEGTWDSVNIGGNNIWTWEDPDAHLYFDDIAIYDVELSQGQVTQLSNK